jgi:hypothetical protein
MRSNRIMLSAQVMSVESNASLQYVVDHSNFYSLLTVNRAFKGEISSQKGDCYNFFEKNVFYFFCKSFEVFYVLEHRR